MNMRTMVMLTIIAVWLFATEGKSGAAGPTDQRQEPNNSVTSRFKWNVPNQPLSKTLANLARAQGLAPKIFRPSPRSWEKGVVSAIDVAGKTYAVAVQTSGPNPHPGVSAEQVVLLTTEGKILDWIDCWINSRYGKVTTEILPKPDADDARIVIRFVGIRYPDGQQLWWHNWHTIGYGGKTWTFRDNDTGKPNIWDEEGLCRIGIADDKFIVLFPKLEMPDLSKTKSIRVGYRADGALKQLVVDDPKQVANLLSAITIKGRNQRYPEPKEHKHVGGEHSKTRVDFFLPDGQVRKMAFLTNRALKDARGGSITLDSTAFFEAISKIVSKAEGRHVELLAEKEKNQKK